MKITVRTKPPAMKIRRPYVLQKIKTAFARLSKDIQGIDLFLLDVNGPKGGVDKVSRIAVDLGRRRILRLEGKGRTVSESLNDTVSRAKHLVARSISRQRSEARKASKKSRPGRD